MTNHAMTRQEELAIEARMIDSVLALALGIAVEVDPEVADYMGAFVEDALDMSAAEGGRFDDNADPSGKNGGGR